MKSYLTLCRFINLILDSMKKFFLAMMLILSASFAVAAATPEEEAATRIANLEKMLKSMPAATGVADLDAYVKASADAGTLAVSNSVLLKAVVEGDATPENILKLGLGVKAEQEALTESTKLAPKAAEGMKSLNPMKMGKAKKALDFGNKCNQIVTEETAYQAEVVAKLGK